MSPSKLSDDRLMKASKKKGFSTKQNGALDNKKILFHQEEIRKLARTREEILDMMDYRRTVGDRENVGQVKRMSSNSHPEGGEQSSSFPLPLSGYMAPGPVSSRQSLPFLSTHGLVV